MSSSMDPHSTHGPSSLFHYSELGLNCSELDDEQDDSTRQFLLSGNQSDRLDIRRSSFHQSYLTPLYGSGYQPIQPPVPDMSNNQLQLCDPSSLPFEGMLLAFDQVPFQTRPDNTHHAASTQCAYPSSLSLPLAEPHTQFGAQDDYADASSLPHERVEGNTLSSVVTQVQSASTHKQTKKEKDVERKRDQRFYDKRDFIKICEILDIPLLPKKTLVHRTLVGLEAMAERQNLDSGLRHQLEEADAHIRYLKARLANLSTEEDIVPIDPQHYAK